MKIRLFIFSVLSLLCMSCSKEKVYDKEGVTFTYPGDWEIYAEEFREEEGYYVGIKKKGFNQSGIFLATFSTKDGEDTFESLIEEALKFYAEAEANYHCTPVVQGTYNGIPASQFSFMVMSNSGIPHRGMVYFLESEKWYVELILQEAEGDIKKK